MSDHKASRVATAMVPVQLALIFIGAVLMVTVVGMIVLAVMGTAIPDELATISVASMTAIAGLLAPNTGLLSTGRTARRAEAAGVAAAAAVVAAENDNPGQHKAVQ